MCFAIMIWTPISLKKKIDVVQIYNGSFKTCNVVIQIITFKRHRGFKGLCNYMDVVKIMKGCRAIANYGWIFKMTIQFIIVQWFNQKVRI